MNKFHQIPTDQFVPISHDNSYLFTHYDKVSNFLAFNLNRNYKNILAKPVQNGYMFDWFSVHEGLININQYGKTETDAGLIKYWEFIEIVNAKIAELSNTDDEDRRNWASLLSKVFNHHNNFIFSNGKEISIVWGWKFDNNEIYKPSIANKPAIGAVQGVEAGAISSINAEHDQKIEKMNLAVEEKGQVDAEKPKIRAIKPIFDEPTEVLGSTDAVKEQDSNKIYGFRGFLQWFAAKFWWLLWLLTFLAALVFFIKAYKV